MLLAGCKEEIFDPRACPVEKKYSKAELEQMAKEYGLAGPTIQQAIADYMKLRDKARACRGAQPRLTVR